MLWLYQSLLGGSSNSSRPSSVNHVFDTSFHGAPNRQSGLSRFVPPSFRASLKGYLTHVGLWWCNGQRED
ncbi:hypothetical protein PG997_013580 [Apiospora hydei]|uniref:Uncharacterized protein n=1 Tax=Apiospora hydei TaxID=1337664 RepID=A0ABR1V6M9_9PEZI